MLSKCKCPAFIPFTENQTKPTMPNKSDTSRPKPRQKPLNHDKTKQFFLKKYLFRYELYVKYHFRLLKQSQRYVLLRKI